MDQVSDGSRAAVSGPAQSDAPHAGSSGRRVEPSVAAVPVTAVPGSSVPVSSGCPSVAVSAELDLSDQLRDDLGWIVGQIQHGYLAGSVAAVGAIPGGLKGFYVLGAAVEGTAHNQIEVARRFGIDRTVMVRLIDDMERAGLVERRPDPADRRARMIIVTARGVREHEAAQDRLRALDDHVLAPLSPADRATFTGMARLVAAHLVAIDPTKGTAACAAVEAQLDAAGYTEPGC